MDKDRKDKDWWDKKKEGVAPTPPHTTNKPESTMVVSQTTTPTQNHNKNKKKKKRKEREVEARGRKGGAASTRHSECVGGVWHTRGTNHTPHPLNTQRERQEKERDKRKDRGRQRTRSGVWVWW